MKIPKYGRMTEISFRLTAVKDKNSLLRIKKRIIWEEIHSCFYHENHEENILHLNFISEVGGKYAMNLLVLTLKK